MVDMTDNQKQEFDRWVSKVSDELFEVEKFKKIGKERDYPFQTLAFMGQAAKYMSLAFTLTESIDGFPEELTKEFRAVAEMYHTLQEKVRGLGKDISGIYAFELCECDTVAARSLDEALAWYKKLTGLEDGDLYAYDDIETVDMNELVYEDENRTKMVSIESIVRQNWNGTPFIVTSTE